jgi:hypothetical protein
MMQEGNKASNTWDERRSIKVMKSEGIFQDMDKTSKNSG